MREYIKLALSLSIIIIIFLACGKAESEKGEKQPRVKVEREKKEEIEREENEMKKIVYGKPVMISNSTMMLIPLLAEYEEKGFLQSLKEYSSYSGSSEVSYSPEGFGRFDNEYLRNVIIYDLAAGKEHLLFDRKLDYAEVFYPLRRSDSAVMNFYLLVTNEKDTDGDEEINIKDEDFVYVSDLEGKNIVQVSPNKIKLTGWNISFRDNLLILNIRRDSDNDNAFTGKDDSDLMATSLSAPSIVTGLISDSLRVKIRNMYD